MERPVTASAALGSISGLRVVTNAQKITWTHAVRHRSGPDTFLEESDKNGQIFAGCERPGKGGFLTSIRASLVSIMETF
jgi:hypothetical protein